MVPPQPGVGVFVQTKIFAIFKKQEVYFLDKPSFMPGRPRRGRFFRGFGRKLFLPLRGTSVVRSAGRVRPSDHPRETHPNISSARKYWGPREYPCRAKRGMGARGPRLRAEKACATSTPGKTPLQTILQAPLFYLPPTRPGGGFAALRGRDAERRRSGPVRHPPAH